MSSLVREATRDYLAEFLPWFVGAILLACWIAYAAFVTRIKPWAPTPTLRPGGQQLHPTATPPTLASPYPLRPTTGCCPGCHADENEWCRPDCFYADPMDYR